MSNIYLKAENQKGAALGHPLSLTALELPSATFYFASSFYYVANVVTAHRNRNPNFTHK